MCFALTDTVVVFDNLRGTLKVVASVAYVAAGRSERAYDDACARIDAVLARLARPGTALPVARPTPARCQQAARRRARRSYEAGVRSVKEYILAGDAFQVVLSQRFAGRRARRSIRSTSTARCA